MIDAKSLCFAFIMIIAHEREIIIVREVFTLTEIFFSENSLHRDYRIEKYVEM